MDPPAGQLPDEKGIHSPEEQIPRPRPLARALHMIEDPGKLGAREIGIEQQAGARAHHLLMPRLAQRRAGRGGAPVLPDDGAMDRAAGAAVPDHGGLALVGDADGGHLRAGDPGPLDDRAAGGGGGGPEVIRLMLDPTGIGIVLRELLLRGGNRSHVGIKEDRPARRCALVDGEDMGHGSGLR